MSSEASEVLAKRLIESVSAECLLFVLDLEMNPERGERQEKGRADISKKYRETMLITSTFPTLAEKRSEVREDFKKMEKAY